MIEEDSVAGKYIVGFSVIDDNPVTIKLSDTWWWSVGNKGSAVMSETIRLIVHEVTERVK